MNHPSTEKQEFLCLVQPHLVVLQSKAFYWASSAEAADRLLDAFLQAMAGRLEDLRESDNARLLLVRELFLHLRRAAVAQDDAFAPSGRAKRCGTPLHMAEHDEDLPRRATLPAEGRGNGLLQGQARTPPKSSLPTARAVSGHF